MIRIRNCHILRHLDLVNHLFSWISIFRSSIWFCRCHIRRFDNTLTIRRLTNTCGHRTCICTSDWCRRAHVSLLNLLWSIDCRLSGFFLDFFKFMYKLIKYLINIKLYFIAVSKHMENEYIMGPQTLCVLVYFSAMFGNPVNTK